MFIYNVFSWSNHDLWMDEIISLKFFLTFVHHSRHNKANDSTSDGVLPFHGTGFVFQNLDHIHTKDSQTGRSYAVTIRYINRRDPWAPSQYPKRRLFVRSRKVSKPRDWYFKLPYRFEIRQAHRQHCCRSACQISERSDNSKYKSRGFEALQDLTERRLFRILRRGPDLWLSSAFVVSYELRWTLTGENLTYLTLRIWESHQSHSINQ